MSSLSHLPPIDLIIAHPKTSTLATNQTFDRSHILNPIPSFLHRIVHDPQTRRHKHKQKPIYTASQKQHREQLLFFGCLFLLIIVTLIAAILALWRARNTSKRRRHNEEQSLGELPWRRDGLEKVPRVEVVQVDGNEAFWVCNWGQEAANEDTNGKFPSEKVVRVGRVERTDPIGGEASQQEERDSRLARSWASRPKAWNS